MHRDWTQVFPTRSWPRKIPFRAPWTDFPQPSSFLLNSKARYFVCYWCISHQISIKLRTLLGIPPSHLLSLLLCFFCFFRYFCYRHFIVGRWLPARSWVPWLIEELFLLNVQNCFRIMRAPSGLLASLALALAFAFLRR